MRDYADVNGDGIIDVPTAEGALKMLEIDELGLDPADRNMLTLMYEKYGDKPVGLNTIAALTGDEASTIEDYLEPFYSLHYYNYQVLYYVSYHYPL